MSLNNQPIQLLLLLPLYLFCACAPDAPHDNPLDPYNNPHYNRIKGNVYSRYSPHLPLDKVEIMIKPSDQIYATNEDGYFHFTNLQPDTYTITASKQIYQSASMAVTFQEYTELKSVNFFLNALPVVTNIEFYSEHIDQWWPGEVYRLQINVVTDDQDGVSDIDTVICSIPGINYFKEFRPTDRPDSFFVSIDDFELPGGSLYSICAESCYVRIGDKAGADIAYGPFFMHRIIEIAPVPQSPIDMQVVSGRPVFVWQSIILPYHFTQEIHLYQLFPGGSILIKRIEKITSDISNYQFQEQLQNGNYIWTIGIRDEGNNFSRSKEASFIIE
jgi:hypothetical protein